MQIVPLGAPLGARVTDIDLNGPLDDALFAQIRSAWLAHCLLVFPDQRLSEASLVAFSRRFGELELPPAGEHRARGDGGARASIGAQRPEIWNISNAKVHGVPVGSLGNLEADWHTDMSYLQRPPSASILHAREIPARGGNTCFANMYKALEDMPAKLRGRLETQRVRHDSAYTSVGELRKGARPVDDLALVEGAVHPAIRVHPETARPALYLGRRLNASFVDLSRAESEDLLDEAWRFCTQPRFTYEHVWTVGDLLVWDNRSTIHRRDAFDDAERRIMWRTQVKDGGRGLQPRTVRGWNPLLP